MAPELGQTGRVTRTWEGGRCLVLMVEVEAGPGLPTAGDAAPGGEGLTQDGCNSTRQLWVPKK